MFLTHEYAEKVLNEFHSSACGSDLSSYATVKKILHDGYFWPIIFHVFIFVVQKCHACQIYDCKTHALPTPLNHVIAICTFAKWGIDFMKCNPHLVGGHGYLIVVVDYFTK